MHLRLISGVTDPRPNLLFLCHRIPYPPDKGDKIRSYRWWKALARKYRVHLGAFVDDPGDWEHVDQVASACTSSLFLPLSRRTAFLRSLSGLLYAQALSIPYYRNARMRAWVKECMQSQRIGYVFVFSSVMAQYAIDPGLKDARRVIDFVDVDSDKWHQYAQRKSWPLSWLYGREARRLAIYERDVAREFDVSLFVSAQEASLFSDRVGEQAGHVTHVRNGVDTGYFDPKAAGENPFPAGSEPVVFTGAMDYWANIDAVAWFAREVWPQVRAARPNAVFVVVGSNPSPMVRALAGPGLLVTGRVPDIRPLLGHARVVVAPMRIARGIQNKVLEGMAMARPVVVTTIGLEGIPATPGSEVLVADDPDEFASRVIDTLSGCYGALGDGGRFRVVQEFSWYEASERLLGLLALPADGIATARNEILNEQIAITE